MKRMTRGSAILALLLVVAACGDDQESAELPINPDAGTDVAAECVEGVTECDDILFPGDEPQDGVLPLGGASGMPIAGGGLSVGEALATDATGILAVHGFYVDSGSGPMLCEALAESFPPQCGGASIPMADASAVDPASVQTNQSTSWSDAEVFIVGEIVDGVLVPTEVSL